MDLTQPRQLFLNGAWRSVGPAIAVTNPATGEKIGEVSTIDRQSLRQAIDDAATAWPPWRERTGKDRGGYLHRIGDRIEACAEELARTITLENGKPLPQSRGEVAMTIDHFHWFAEESRRGYGRVVPHQIPGKRHLVLKSPVGVVGAIAPWNFPLVLAARKIAPALAAGCPVLLKPASATPLSSVLLAEAVNEADLPAGLFQLVVGNAEMIADEFFSHPACRKVSFTGSTEVGRLLIRRAADQVTNLSMELGGHAPLLVFEDADLNLAVEGALIAKFRNTGQSCIAANRVYVHQSCHDEFVERFVAKTKELKLGNGLDDGVDIGPLIDESSLKNSLDQIDDARQGGAKILCGGRRWDGLPGPFLEPTVLVDVPEAAMCLHEETFAPIAPVLSFHDEAEVLAKANQTPYGLAAYVYTENLARALRVAECLEAGTVGVNDAVPATSQCPFGGMKQSGLGRELGSEGLDAFLETKHVSFGALNS